MAPGAARAALILALLLIGAASPEPAPAPAAPAPAAAPAAAPGRYLGKDLGALSQLHHAVRGRVFAVDARTIYLKDFHYDGEGPAAYFYVGTGKAPSAAGTRLRDERGAAGPLRRYRGESFTLSLPEGKTLKDFRTFYVWCDDFAVNFGDVSIPRELEYPRPARLGALRGVHGVSSDAVVVVDAQTLLVANFSYDGEAPDAKFWVGRGSSPSPQGLRIPDESGRDGPLRKYDRKTIVLTLPGELTVFDIGHFGVWCEAFTVDFGHVQLPARQVANVPPSLKMLGVSPQSKLNCEVLLDELAFEVRWAVAGDSVVLQLVAKLEDGDYMSFGISGDDKHSQMVGADVAVAWVDKQTLKGYSEDYYLDAKSQCAGSRGACPDEKFASNTNSLRVLNAALVNGYSIVTYQRSARAADAFDRPVLLNASQPVVWALGPLNQRLETSYHHHYNKMDKFIEFGRPPVWNCPMPEAEEDHHESAPASTSAPAAASASSSTSAPARHTNTSSALKSRPVPPPAPAPRVTPWEIPGVQCYEPADGVFYAQMGPTGGRQGYPAITGHVGWGISWYINGLLIPELTLVRDKRYTFVVEGGADPAVPARYHPFYITNDPVGGYYHRSDEEKQGVEIYAGVRRTRTGELVPTGVGRLCNWTPDPEGPGADEYPSFGAYQRSLTLVCEEGNPGVVTWTPDKNTPDTVYYQCFTHRHLGWKIHIVDECEESEAAESRLTETFALPEDLQQEESIQVVNRARPEHNFLDHRMKVEKIINTKINYNDFSSDSRGDGGLSGDVMYRVEPLRNQPLRQEYELPVSKLQIKQVIDAVESLESQMQDDLRNNITHMPIRQYQVHEDVKEFFLPEQPFREEDEYIVDSGTMPNKHLFPPNQKPLTLQTVLRPNGPNRQKENIRPPFRRPVPPEIKLRRPQPMHQGPNMYQKVSNIYPLPMPNPHGPHLMQKKPLYKHNPNNNRLPPNMNRPPQMNGAPPLKLMPHMQMHPKPGFIVPQMKQQIMPNIQNGPSPTIILGKPINLPHPSQSQTLNLGQADLIVNQIVKSQITLPGSNDAIAQFSAPQTYFNKPGQIILGKPMENPVPLDQQIIQTKYQAMQSPSTDPPETYASTSLRPQTDDSEHSPDNDMKSSDFIGESVDPPNFQPAVNTGFKPDSIVIESGFKPIIREPLMAGEDKIADYSGSNSNRRQDSDVEEDYEEALQPISNSVNKISSDRLTETFEPMFIPSPPDHILPSNDRTKEVFPSNHAKEDRPHPIYVKTESELNALFAKKNNDKQYSSDAAMESDKVSSHYLPPDPKLPEEHSQNISDENTFTTFDGKTVSASTLTNVSDVKKITKLFSSKLPAGSDVLLRTPQFGPFKGETLPSLNEENKYEVKENDTDANTTLQPVTISHKLQNNTKDLKGDDSEVHEATEKNEATKTESEEEGEYDDEEVEQEPDEKRHRRSIT